MTTSKKTQKSPNFVSVLTPILLILIVILGGLYWVKFNFQSDPRSSGMSRPAVGVSLPNFSLTQMDDTAIPVSQVHGKVILMNFWATWCEACMEEMPSLVKLWKKYHPKGLQIIAINLDENPGSVVPRVMSQYQMQFPVFQDPEGKIAELLDVHAIPLTVIMNKERKILYMRDGEKNWNSPEVHAQMERWLAE